MCIWYGTVMRVAVNCTTGVTLVSQNVFDVQHNGPMNTLLSPAITLMDRLRYPRKFVLVSLLFIIPLALVTTLFATSVTADVRFTQRELAGTTYLRSLVTLFDHLLKQLSNGQAINGSAITDAEKIDQVFSALHEVDVRSGSMLGTTAILADLEADWRRFQAAPGGSQQHETTYRNLITKTRQLITQVGDASNLILDPEIDSYYVMDTVLLKLPTINQQATEIGLFARYTVAQRQLSANERLEGSSLVGQLEATIEEHRQGLDTLRQNNPTAYASLERPAQVYVERMTELIQYTRVIIDSDTSEGSGEAAPLVIRARQAGQELWGQSITTLDRLLQARLDRYNQQLALAAGAISVGLGLALYFCSGMYQSMVSTIATLDHASQRMIRGDITAPVQLRSRDELSEVTRVFNDVAVALVAASAQRQAVVDNAADGILTVDTDGIITSLNPAAQTMFGHNHKLALNQPLTVLLPTFSISSTSNRQQIVDGQRADGSHFPCELTVSELRGHGLSGAIVITRDISELRRVEAERAQLQEAIIHAQVLALDELSTPLIPITNHLLVMPLIGTIDPRRAERIVITLLHGIKTSRARAVILDITGVPVVDTMVAASLLKLAQSVRLLGATLILTGIRPEIAQTIVGLGINMNAVVTRDSLQNGIAYAVSSGWS